MSVVFVSSLILCYAACAKTLTLYCFVSFDLNQSKANNHWTLSSTFWRYWFSFRKTPLRPLKIFEQESRSRMICATQSIDQSITGTHFKAVPWDSNTCGSSKSVHGNRFLVVSKMTDRMVLWTKKTKGEQRIYRKKFWAHVEEPSLIGCQWPTRH